jgi:hypothetical protein
MQEKFYLAINLGECSKNLSLTKVVIYDMGILATKGRALKGMIVHVL